MGADRPARHARRHSPVKPGAPVAARMLLVALSISIFVAGTALAQTSRPTITVTATVPAEPATQAPLAIRVGPPDAVPKGSFIRIRGLPPTMALSDGHSIAPGSWAVPIAALPNLKITLPAVAAGKSEISITLVGSDGSVLAEAKSVLVVAASSAPDSRTQNKSEPPPISILRAGVPLQAPQKRRNAPVRRSRRRTGETHAGAARACAAAREARRRAVDGGWHRTGATALRARCGSRLAQGAMSMAATYDAVELGRLGVRGLQPDRAAAMRWYERARQLGAAEAEQRLRRLGAN